MKTLTKEFVTSLITIILAISAIAIFIRSGGTYIFYIAIAIAIIFGFYNVWLISNVVSKSAKPAHASKVVKGKKG